MKNNIYNDGNGNSGDKVDTDSAELLFVSANKHKLQYAKELLETLDVKVTCIESTIQEFNTDDLFLIAAGKVTEAYLQTRKPCIVLDTAFYIKKYPDEPNFPGTLIKQKLLEPLGVDGLLEKMKDVENRQCYFKECLVYYDGDCFQTFYGHRHGTLLKEKHGTSTEEAWSELWSVFKPRGSTKTLAEMTKEERASKDDLHLDALELFANWYCEQRLKHQELIKRVKK